MPSYRYKILGSGAFGTALASVAARNHHATLLGRNKNVISYIQKYHENCCYLKGLKLPENLQASEAIVKHLQEAERIIFAIPAQQMRKVFKDYKEFIPKNIPLILSAKGIEQETGMLMHDIAYAFYPDNEILLLSGPSFADDIVQDLPVAVTIAAKKIEYAQKIAQELSYKNFRCYANDDMIGVALGGALKNIFALASGLCLGKGLGQSANAALITRSFSELRRIAIALGARPETLCGLSGFGDLYLTCSNKKSRNFTYGFALAKGENTKDLKLAEGVASTEIAAKICQDYNINAPIITIMQKTLEQKITLEQAITELCLRPLKNED